MKFHEYQTLFSALRSAGSVDPRATEAAWYAENLHGPTAPADPIVIQQLRSERDWLADHRPYYSVYPLVADSLLKLPLDLDCGLVRLPLPALLVRFPLGHELDVLGDGARKVRAILAARSQTTRGDGLTLLADFGERPTVGTLGALPIYSYRTFALTPGQSLEASLGQIDRIETDTSNQESEAALLPCVRLICTLCLIGDDPSIITPDVLDKDRIKYAQTTDPAIVERARRRGKVGWLIGANLEVDPHYRRPHFALRWTGHGRTVPRIVPVKGAVVHRQKLAEIPHGRLDD